MKFIIPDINTYTIFIKLYHLLYRCYNIAPKPTYKKPEEK